MTRKQSLGARMGDAVTMLIVSLLSITVLLYVAYGTARRSYEQAIIEASVAQGQLIQSSMETFIRPGLPLHQFVGFQTLAEPIVKADNGIDGMIALDNRGERVFTSGNQAVELRVGQAGRSIASGQAELIATETHYLIRLPLKNRFEVTGSLVLTMQREKMDDRVDDSFRFLLFAGIGLSALFSLFVFMASGGTEGLRARELGAAFAVMFLLMSAIVISSLIAIYSDGAQAKGKALVNSLGQRLSDIVTYKLNFDEIRDIDEVFAEYRRLNPQVSAVALTIDGKIAVHTDKAMVSRYWVREDHIREYVADLAKPSGPRLIRVVVAMPKSVVYQQIARSVKNFAALFVATAFFALLFVQVARSIKLARNDSADSESSSAAVTLVQPAFFVGVFVEHLTYAFLPQLIRAMTESAGLSSGYASLPFMAYYMCFAIVLIPAGRYETRLGPRPLVVLGLILTAVGFLLLGAFNDFYMAVLARCASGIGQGMLFIGAQSYVLANATAERRTRGAATIVFGFQGGMISGMAIGSLLVRDLTVNGIFYLGVGIACAGAAYALIVLPRISQEALDRAQRAAGNVWREIGQIVRDGQFLRTISFIGAPAKAVLTGVMLFALPLILTKNGFAQEDIGQITMIYAGAVILASTYAANAADRAGQIESLLLWGAAISAVGLLMIACIEWRELKSISENAPTVLLLAGVAIVGLAHGMINAPVVTFVTDSDVSSRIGAGPVAAAYRFLERVGHTAGPIIIGQIFAASGISSAALVGIAVMVLILGFLFVAMPKPKSGSAYQPETTR